MNKINAITILLVEDDPGHARLIEKNLRRANLTNHLQVLSDGQQALDYVFSEGLYRQRDPSGALLLLLDLNLPILDGYQVLKRIKNNEQTKHIPVIVLTTTDDSREIAQAYELGCNIFITKPVEYSQFAEAIRQLGLFLAVVSITEQ